MLCNTNWRERDEPGSRDMPDLKSLMSEPIAICAVGAAVGVLIIWLVTKLGWLKSPSDSDAGE